MEIERIEISRLTEHPDNPNRMSNENFRKLKRHIQMSGRYEPIIVRKVGDGFQIINGHHRVKALAELGYKEADCVVWDVTDHQTDILLMTLNRLGGKDVLEKKSEILKRLSEKCDLKELSKLLPASAKQIQTLQNLKLPHSLAQINIQTHLEPMVFFLSHDQRAIVEKTLGPLKGQDKSLALVNICQSSTKDNDNIK